MASNSKHGPYILGIDLGTTTVKVALIDTNTKEVSRTKSRETKAAIHSEVSSLGNEQDADKILTALQFCVSGLPKEDLIKVIKVGISGQMHGVMLWDKEEGWTRNNLGRLAVCSASQLFTWQDGRCGSDFIATLPLPDSHLKLATGLGCVTLFWLKQNSPEVTEKYDCAGTIQDYVVSMLCGLQKPVMSVHNAASWGYFDTQKKTWNKDILSEAGFPIHLLPDVEAPGAIVGQMQSAWYGIPKDTPVGAAMGDLQCSILSRLNKTDDAVLNLSTSAQLAFQMHDHFVPPPSDATSTIEYFPFFNNRYLAVAASLTGGNVMAAFVKMLQQWTHELGLGVPESKIWEKLHQLGQNCSNTDLHISPRIFGERHSPNDKASVVNITHMNTTLGSVYAALCKGIISNLHGMMSQDFLLAAGVKRIVGSGTAVIKNSILRHEIESQYKLQLVLSEESEADAAVGVALVLMDSLST